jgi:methyl-accepting chemotaxis protein
MGNVADNLRKTFQSLNRMTRELVAASGAVDGEVSKTAGVTDNLHKEVASQTYFADQTTQSVKSMEQGMQRVSKAMEQVANATQEVSSTILQMQASVEEIARNSDVLMESVEKTVSSSNEIAASSSEVKGATDKLHQSSQEAVSFLAELDASLEETRRNAKSLSEASTRMTQDAETGFNSVAAVEEEIMRTSKATEDSRNTLQELVVSIEKIGRIVGVIQDVTEQTNLLSLNASIIAAGAGEYGKSFAVVATQIRELSARTAGNAKEIRTLIHTLTQGGSEMASSMEKTFTVVGRSADLSREAGAALRTILESASSQEEMNKRIASATEELAHGGQSANRAMHRIFEMIEGISRATKDQVASTQYLNDEAERVRDVALQLKNATEEQAKGTRVISEAVTHIMEDSHQANQAVNAQTKESSAIYDAMKQIAATAQSVEEAFGELTEASAHLQRSAALLRQEIRAFKTT